MYILSVRIVQRFGPHSRRWINVLNYYYYYLLSFALLPLSARTMSTVCAYGIGSQKAKGERRGGWGGEGWGGGMTVFAGDHSKTRLQYCSFLWQALNFRNKVLSSKATRWVGTEPTHQDARSGMEDATTSTFCNTSSTRTSLFCQSPACQLMHTRDSRS